MQIVFYLAFIFYALAGLTLAFISSQKAVRYAQRSPEESYSFFKLLRTEKLLKLSIFFASVMFFVMMFRPFVPQFLADIYHFGDFEIGVLGSVSFFGSTILGTLLGRLGDRRKKSHALSASMAICSLSLILLLLIGNFYALIITFFLIGGSYMTWSLMSAIIGPLAPESMRARWVSIPQTVSMFSSFIAPYIGGILYGSSAYYPFAMAIIAAATLALLAFSNPFEK
jgi:MFS family permease